jgi:hypothetical protein
MRRLAVGLVAVTASVEAATRVKDAFQGRPRVPGRPYTNLD